MCFRSHQAYERPLLMVLLLKKWHQLLIWWRQQWEQSWKERLMKPLELCPIEREQVESTILPASLLQDHNSALFIRVLIKKSREFQALIWCIRSSKTSKKSGRPDGTFLLCDCVCMPQVCLMFGPGSGSVSEDELVRICMQGHTRRDWRDHTPSFEDLFMREAVFLDVTVCHRRKRGKVDWQICQFGVYLPVHRPLLVWFLIF